MRFRFDVDSDARDLSRQDFLGRADTELADIVASPYGTLTLKLR